MKKETITQHYSNGNKSCETPYVNEKVHGLRIVWYSNGKKSSEIPYKNNIQHGSRIDFR